MSAAAWFTEDTVDFLAELAVHNDRAWFAVNRERYEASVRRPALEFIEAFAPRLESISRHFRADPRPVGGSLFRIHRDVRFSKDKSPYKTHVGIHFRHEAGRDAHAPGYYLHVEPGRHFMGAGVWHPGGQALRAIREAIVARPGLWKEAKRAEPFRSRFEFAGDALKTHPRGFDPDHLLIEDLRRKDFIAVAPLESGTVTGPGLIEAFESGCRAAIPLQRFLCHAVGVDV